MTTRRKRASFLALLLVPLTCALTACATVEARDARATAPVQDERSAEELVAAADEHFAARRWAEAEAGYEEALALDPDRGKAWFRLGYARHVQGDLEAALEAHEKATDYPQWAPIAAYNAACANALLDRPDAAFAALDRAVALGFADLAQLEADPDLDALRDDPRFAALRERLGADAAGADDPRRRLDFWVGEWVVTDAEGERLGTNSITKRENGHLILEEWTGARGGTGTSMNYWDRDAERWKQVWVSANGTVLQMAGAFTDGAMRLEGVTLYPDGRNVPHRTTLTPLDDGRVHQLIEESEDDGATWHPAFEGFYAPREDGGK